MARRDRFLGLAALLVGILVVGLIVAGRPFEIPSQLSAAPLERTATEQEHAGKCLARVALGTGWVDACWSVDRLEGDGSDIQDYYQFRLSGSYEGLKWLVARADLVGQPNSGGYVVWPDFLVEGACREINVHLRPAIDVVEPTETVCGRTDGDLEPVSWIQRMTWTCERCLLPDRSTKALSMYAQVSVDAGTFPVWDLYLDGGSST